MSRREHSFLYIRELLFMIVLLLFLGGCMSFTASAGTIKGTKALFITAGVDAEAEAKKAEEKAAAEALAKAEAEKKAQEEAAAAARLILPDGRTLTPLGSFRITGYCPCYQCSEGHGSMTAIGTHARSGRTVAVDPRVIPYGTHLLINGHEYVAEDCGGAVKRNHIDVYFDSHREAANIFYYTEVYIIR